MAVSGQNAKLYVAQFDVTADFRDLEWERSVEPIDVTTFGALSYARIPGLKDGTLSASGYWSGDVDEVDERLAAVYAVTGKLVSAYMNGDNVGSPGVLTGSIASSYSIGAQVGGAVAVGLEFTAGSSVPVLSAVSLHAMGPETGTANIASVDNAAASTNGYTANLHVSAIAGAAPSVVVKIQHSTDNSTWVDLVSFTAATAKTSEQKTGTGTVNRYVRAVHTFGGTTTSITYALSFARAQ
jgi:hypothetical protein